jgi:hypothetical protein
MCEQVSALFVEWNYRYTYAIETGFIRAASSSAVALSSSGIVSMIASTCAEQTGLDDEVSMTATEMMHYDSRENRMHLKGILKKHPESLSAPLRVRVSRRRRTSDKLVQENELVARTSTPSHWRGRYPHPSPCSPSR